MASELQDPRPVLLSIIDIDASRVEISDKPIVLLCGGLVPIKDHPDDPAPPVASLRHAVTVVNTSYEIFRPEEIKSWQSDAVFTNLMSFETDLASICSLVVIILESAGAIAELGAFSQLPDLSKKIISITSSAFTNEPSFINLGILRHIAESHPSAVKSYPWDIDNPQLITTEVIDDVISDIQLELDRLSKSHVLKPSQNSHVVVIICEIIRLFSALKESEILDYLHLVGVTIDREGLRRKLFLLEEFRLIKKASYSDAKFYIRTSEPYHELRLAFEGVTTQDTLRISTDCLQYYRDEPSHRNRIRAIAQVSKEMGK